MLVQTGRIFTPKGTQGKDSQHLFPLTESLDPVSPYASMHRQLHAVILCVAKFACLPYMIRCACALSFSSYKSFSFQKVVNIKITAYAL